MNALCRCGCGEQAPVCNKTDARKGHVKGEPVAYIAGHYQRMVMSRAPAPSAVQSRTLAWTDTTALSERDIALLAEGDEQTAAQTLDARLRAIGRAERQTFVETGLIVSAMEQRQLWRHLSAPDGQPYHSFNAWVMAASGVSRSTAYAAWKTLQALSWMDLDDLRQIPHCNARRLIGLSTAVQRDPRIIDAAKRSEKEFLDAVTLSYPEQHVEADSRLTLKPEVSARGVMEAAWEVACWVYDVTRREDAQEHIAAYFLDGGCEREAFATMSNREAFAARREA